MIGNVFDDMESRADMVNLMPNLIYGRLVMKVPQITPIAKHEKLAINHSKFWFFNKF
jgi:hypothetical protein